MLCYYHFRWIVFYSILFFFTAFFYKEVLEEQTSLACIFCFSHEGLMKIWDFVFT